MSEKTSKDKSLPPMPERCVACGGTLMDEEDYLVGLRWRRILRTVPAAALACAVWSPVLCLTRLALGGGFSEVEGNMAAFLLGAVASKALVGAVLGALVGVASGVWRGDVGMFAGMVLGTLGAFFVAASPVLPLRAEAEYRNGLVAVSLAGGVLLSATGFFVDRFVRARWGAQLGPEPFEPDGNPSA